MKSNTILAGLLAGTLALAGLCGAGRADTTKEEKKEAKKGVLTHESLKEMLENLGYTPEVIKSTSGSPMNKIKFERDGWTYVVYVSLSGGGSHVWLAAPLKDIPDGLPSGDPLKKILAASNDVGPCHFVLKGDRLYLSLALANRDLKPAMLRAGLDDTAGTVKSTVGVWNVEFKAKEAGNPKAEPKK
ncbi:MAG: hypothetical protein K2W96_25490 [Gemmataceae bacterium]|nr:hypothetical protein [Gemmataceae bacterium]